MEVRGQFQRIGGWVGTRVALNVLVLLSVLETRTIQFVAWYLLEEVVHIIVIVVVDLWPRQSI
jgi:hypothetical protein